MAFAAWVGKKLPTEDEWEAATRTAHGYLYPWGNEWKKDACNIEESYLADTTPVDKYIDFANDFGVVDGLGGILEWTTGIYNLSSGVTNETKYRIVKGGSWVSDRHVRLCSRFKMPADTTSNVLGFRCVAY